MSKNKGTTNLPNLSIPDNQKDEAWHKKFVQSITSDSINDQFSLNYTVMDECVNFYQGLQTGENFKFLQEAEDGDVLPAEWINFNKIKTKIDLLLGELVEKSYEISVKALNKDAKVRKLEEKERIRVEMKLKELSNDLESTYGVALNSGEYVPETEEELDEYFNYNYKEKSEIIMESALKYIARKNNWDYERMSLLRDIFIMGKCVTKSEIKNGIPVTRRIDPRLVIHDPNATDDFLSDATYYGEVRYMGVAEAAEQYNLKQEEIKHAYNAYQEYERTNIASAYTADFSLGSNNKLSFFKTDAGELKTLVLTAYWADTKTINNKVSQDKYGNEHIKSVSEDYEKPDKLKRRIKIWRQGTLIGGKFLKEWGEINNQPRDIDSLSETTPPIKILIPNYLNGVGISKVHQLKGLQNLKDIVLYNMQLSLARAGAKGFVYDVSQVPDDWDVHTVIKYLKTVGIAFVDSKKDGIPSTFNQFQQIDMTISTSIDKYLDISMFIDREMDSISGVNEARQGIVTNSSQAVGVTQSSLFQSNLSTATYFKLFESYCSNLLNYQAGLVKIAWAGKEKFAPIIGDTGIDFLANEVDLELNDYGVFADSIPQALSSIQQFQELVMAALQSGQLEFVDAMKLLKEKDVTLAIRRFEKDIAKKEEKEMQKEMQLAEQQQEAAQSQQESIKEQQAYLQQLQTESNTTIQDQKDAAKLEQILAKGRIDLAGKKIDAVSKQLKDISKK